ncbi:hypothetical protein ACHAXR_011815 [Thalassiosira sp. AJA248-18]
MAASRPPTGINGRPVAISPAAMSYQFDDQSGGGGGVLSSIFCGGADNTIHPFLLCDGGSRANEVDFDVNPTGVYVAVHTKQWNLACERVKVYPREASTWVVRYGNAEVDNNASGIGSTSSDRGERIAVASPRSGSAAATPTQNKRGPKVLRWRMLPIHAAILFGAPAEVVKTLIKIYPAGLSSQDDQGMFPLHLAFRSGASEEMVLILLDAYPEAIERIDFKGRLPSMMAPKTSMSYGDLIGEAFIKGPSYYYWASRVAACDRARNDAAMTKRIKELEEDARINNERQKEMVEKTERLLNKEIEALSIENVELKDRLVWYENKYDGAEEKEKVLVDHTNSLAERLRLTSLSEEHLATKLAKLEARLQTREMELDHTRNTAKEERKALSSRISQLEQTLAKTEHKAESLTENLEKKIMESNETKVRFDKERHLFEKQIDASKECLMELIASSKEDKRMFEEDSKELRRQLQTLQSDVQKASMNNEKRMYEEDSQELRRQLMAIQSEVQKSASANSSAAVPVIPRALEDRLDNLQKEVANNTRVMSHVNAEDQGRSTKEIENRLDNLQKEVANARSYMNRDATDKMEPVAEYVVQQSHSSSSRMDTVSADRSVNSTKRAPKVMRPQPEYIPEDAPEDEEPFDTYVSTKSVTSCADQTRDDTECFSHASDVDTALALGELSMEQRTALEQLDLSGSREEIAAMLCRVPGLTKNQVNLLVDVASSLAV